MTNQQWRDLINVVNGKGKKDLVAFIIDSPWLPGFAEINTIDYYTSDTDWFESNLRAINTFPDVTFLPGFWSEFGMCTEPSAFGAKCIWQTNELPHANKVIYDIGDIQTLKTPNPKTDGLLPFVIQRLKKYESRVKSLDHAYRFAISRGPLNIATFLMGTTEFMMGLVMNPEEIHQLLRKITDFTINWLSYQKELFNDIEGIFILDDLVGFIGETEFSQFAQLYLTEIFNAFETEVRFFHNDAQGLVCSKYLEDIGVNLFNFSHEHSISEIRSIAGEKVSLLGNIPPRDVLAGNSESLLKEEISKMVNSNKGESGIIWSAGGGMPPGVSSKHIEIFYKEIKANVSNEK